MKQKTDSGDKVMRIQNSNLRFVIRKMQTWTDLGLADGSQLQMRPLKAGASLRSPEHKLRRQNFQKFSL